MTAPNSGSEHRPSPGALWVKARAEVGPDRDAVRARYRELLTEHGHMVPREPGDDGDLPCGWPGNRSAS